MNSILKILIYFTDIDVDIFDSNHGALDLSQKAYNSAQITVKQEPVENETDNGVSSNSNNNVDPSINGHSVNTGPNISSCTMTHTASNNQPTIIFSTATKCQIKTEPQILSAISIKSEPNEFMDTSPDHSGNFFFMLYLKLKNLKIAIFNKNG